MATIDATVGGSSANSYSTVAAADAYFENRLHSAVYTAASADDKIRALVMASLAIDRMTDFEGTKVATTQALSFPRAYLYDDDGYEIDHESIPVEVFTATCELALFYLSGDKLQPSDTAGIKNIKVDVIGIEFDKIDRAKPIPKEIFSPLSKWGRLRGYSSTVDLVRG